MCDHKTGDRGLFMRRAKMKIKTKPTDAPLNAGFESSRKAETSQLFVLAVFSSPISHQPFTS